MAYISWDIGIPVYICPSIYILVYQLYTCIYILVYANICIYIRASIYVCNLEYLYIYPGPKVVLFRIFTAILYIEGG